MASLVLFSAQPEQCAGFYSAAGVTLAQERHDEGPSHYAAELQGVHFAIYQAEGEIRTAGHRQPGEVFVGLYVDSLDETVTALRDRGAQQTGEHERMPWGCRVLFLDPDGRTIEINARNHC